MDAEDDMINLCLTTQAGHIESLLEQIASLRKNTVWEANKQRHSWVQPAQLQIKEFHKLSP